MANMPPSRRCSACRCRQAFGLIDAGGLPETFCTVWTNVFERMRLQSGEVFLVQGGSSGIGVTAIQLAKAFGAKVLATAGSDEKCRACLDYGADVAINYRTQDFVQVGKEFTNGRGVDAILDMVGGDYIPRQLDLLAHEGRLCFVALMRGSKVETDFGLIQRKHLTVTGSTLRSRSVTEKAAIIAALREKVWPLWAAGKLRPFTYKTVSAGRGRRSSPADGIESPHRQDPARPLTIASAPTHIGAIMRESLEPEGKAPATYRELLSCVEGRSVLLEEYAWQMVYAEELHASEEDKLLRPPGEVTSFRPGFQSA